MNGTDTVIVRRGEDIITPLDESFVTVYDDNDNRYVIGIYAESYYLHNDGFSDEFNPRNYNCGIIHAAYVEGSVPNNNWLILEWLKDNYNFDFSSFNLVEASGENLFESFAPTYTCSNENILLVGSPQPEVTKAIYDDANFFGEFGLLNCEGTHFTEEYSEHYAWYELYRLGNLSNAESNVYEKAGAYNAIILMLGNHMTSVL